MNQKSSLTKVVKANSLNLPGPYLDREDVAMTDGGGSLLIEEGSGAYPTDGQAAVFSEGGGDWLSCQYSDEDRDRDGLPWVEVRRMDWEDGWPVHPGEIQLYGIQTK